MKLLLIGPEVTTLDDVRNFSGVWSYYLRREFLQAGVKLRFAQPDPTPKAYARLRKPGETVLALGTRHFDKAPEGCLTALREAGNGIVAQIHDGKTKAPVDVTFTVKEVDKPCHVAVGWAGDPEMLFPQQSKDELTILIDHPDYVRGRGGDITGYVLSSVADFIVSGVWRKRFRSIVSYRIADGGLVPAGAPLQPFTRSHMPYAKMCESYCRAHIFMVTHPESVGLAALEAAMAGALPVVMRGFINEMLLATVMHHSYHSVIDWAAILGKIDPAQSHKAAAPNSWSAVAERIIRCLKTLEASWTAHRHSEPSGSGMRMW